MPISFTATGFKNGTLPIALSEQEVEQLFERHSKQSPYRLTVDLESQTVTDDAGFHATFEIEPFRRHCLLHGLDDIALTLEQVDKIDRYEQQLAE